MKCRRKSKWKKMDEEKPQKQKTTITIDKIIRKR